MNDQAERTARELFTRAESAKETREKLIDSAIHLFYLHGVHAVALDQILKEVGVTKTTFYKYFESKDDLVYSALQRRDAWEMEWFHNAIRQAEHGDPRCMLLAVFDVLHDWFTAPRFSGIQFINATAEFPNVSDPIYVVARQHKSAIRGLIRNTALRAGARDPDQVSGELMLLLEGATALRLSTGDNSAARIAHRLAEMVVELSLSKSS